MSEQQLLEYIKKFNLHIPPGIENMAREEQDLWQSFFEWMVLGILSEVIDTAEITIFEQKFFNTEFAEKPAKLEKLVKMIQEAVMRQKAVEEYFTKKNFEEEVEKIKKEVKPIFVPYIDYLAYSMFLGKEIDPQVENEVIALSKLTDKEIHELETLQIEDKIAKARSKGFRLDEGKIFIPNTSREFNKPLSADLISQIIDSQHRQTLPPPPKPTQVKTPPRNNQNFQGVNPMMNNPQIINRQNNQIPRQNPNPNPNPNFQIRSNNQQPTQRTAQIFPNQQSAQIGQQRQQQNYQNPNFQPNSNIPQTQNSNINIPSDPNNQQIKKRNLGLDDLLN
jgi:hypothetical protein